MILVVDNYDSFTYNLVQLFECAGADLRVVPNDAHSVEELAAMKPDGILFSPGPGTPNDAGVTLDAIRHFAGTLPLLGVCLGHQAIAQAFGARVVAARALVHGRTSIIEHDGKGLFQGISQGVSMMRYHSLAVDAQTLTDDFLITARTSDGEVMGLRHRSLPIESVQFHPESFLSESGDLLARNFLRLVNVTKTDVAKRDRDK